MTAITICGFETGTALDVNDGVIMGTGSVQSSIKRTGSYALRINPAAADNGYTQHQEMSTTGAENQGIDTATVYYRFYFYIATAPAANSEELCTVISNTAALKLALRLTSARKLQVYDSTNTQMGSDGATTLALTTWYKIEIKCGTGAAADYEVKIGETSEFSGTGSLHTNNNGALRVGKVINRNTQAVDFYYDDIAIDDAAYPGAGQSKIMVPNADGNYTTWTVGAGPADKWDCVNGIPYDAGSYLLSTLTVGQAYTAALQSSADAGISVISIFAVRAIAICTRDGAANSTIRLRLRSTTTDSDTASDRAIGAGVSATTKIYPTDPATAAAWTESGLNGCEVGAIERETTDKTRLLAAYLMVDYVPLSTAGNRGYIF